MAVPPADVQRMVPAIRASLGNRARTRDQNMLAIFDRVVIVTGSRKWTDRVVITRELSAARPSLIAHCGAVGADALSSDWAAQHGVPVHAFPKLDADWQKYGKQAGHVANELVCATYPLALVLAFPLPDSRGTRDCINIARRRGMALRVVGE